MTLGKILVILFLGFLLPSVLAPTARADIFRYVDERGVVHFTNTPTDQRFRFYRKESGDRDGLGGLIQRYARYHGLEEALVRAVIKVESDYDPRAVSSKGAQGLMQLMPQTASLLEVGDPLDPESNIRGGTRYLRMMLDRFRQLDLALAAYNAGPTAVQRYGGIPPYPETREYVRRVRRYLDHYRNGKDVVL